MQLGKDKVGLLLLRTKQCCLLLFVAPFPPLDVFLPWMLNNLGAVAPKLPKNVTSDPVECLLWGVSDCARLCAGEC